MSDSRVVSEEGLQVLAQLRAICRAYPEVHEHIDDFGHTSFRVRDKPFIIMGEGGGELTLNFKLLHETQDFLVQTGSFTQSAYIGQHGWTALRARSPLDWPEITDLIDEAYRRTAPQTLLAKLDKTAR